MKINFSKVFFSSLVIILLIISLNACKDEILHDHEDHFEAEGMVFYIGDRKILEIFRGVTQDTFFVPVGSTTSNITIKFLDSDRKVINPPDHKKKPMAYEIVDNSIVNIIQAPEKRGMYEFQFEGKKIGRTEVEFFIMHEGHPDFRSKRIPVKVN